MKKGFTLVEILAVIAIIGMLSIMIIPSVVKLFNGAVQDSMKVTENEVLDAANLYIEDFCRNPINDDYRSNCNQDRKEMEENKVYFCLSSLQGRKVIKDVYYKESVACKGIIIYNYESYKYSNPKVYLFCGDGYTTDGGSAYSTYANEC